MKTLTIDPAVDDLIHFNHEGLSNFSGIVMARDGNRLSVLKYPWLRNCYDIYDRELTVWLEDVTDVFRLYPFKKSPDPITVD